MGIIFTKPLIGVIMCQFDKDGHPTQMVHNKYLEAIFQAGGIAVALPHMLMDAPQVLENSMARLDGILLTGSPSNIEPHHYGESGHETFADPGRDRLAFHLVDYCIAQNMPLFAICRGLQELVVATGGKLHRKVQEVPGLLDHREDEQQSLEVQYGHAHIITPHPTGLLARLGVTQTQYPVNSLHQQGIRDIGPQLQAEAHAPDGLIEAVSLPAHPFALAVQWHPEWHSDSDALSQQMYAAFIQACLRYRQDRPYA